MAKRIGFLVSHPIQYYAPIFRELARRCDLTVFFAHRQTPEQQARAGFEEEEKKGVPRDAGHRNYKDASHKPELLCALTPFDALCGFRTISETIELFDRLAVKALEDKLAPLRATRDTKGLAETFRLIMSTPEVERLPIVDAVDALIAGRANVDQALDALMTRPPRAEGI